MCKYYAFIPAFTTTPMTSDFLSLGWVVTFLDSRRVVFTFRSWFDLLSVVLAFQISILNIISKSLQNCWHRLIDITSFEKHLQNSLDHTPNFSRKVIFRFKSMCEKELLTRSSMVIWCTRNAHMVKIVNWIPFEMVYTS